MFFTILSTIFANNHNVALYGYPNRYEGMFTLLFYCFLYLDCKLLSSDVDVKYLIKIMISVSIIHLIVVITQLTGIYEKIIYMYTSGNAIGLTENCNFLGSLMCLISAISISGYLLYNKQEKSYYYLFIMIVSYITLLLANSSGPFISLIVTFIILLIVLSIKKRIDVKKVVIVSILLITLYPICLSKRDEITPEIKSNIKIILNLFNNKEESSKLDGVDNNSDNNSYQPNVRDLGNGRIKIWKNVWSLIKEKPILGYGPDNLGLVYEKGPYDTKNADKAHNIYLHIFVSSGLFAVIGYVLWVGYTIYSGLKSQNNTILILCFGIIAYSIQGFFNINVIEVCPYFYLTVGFMMLLVKENKLSLGKNN